MLALDLHLFRSQCLRLVTVQAPQAPWGGPGTNIGPQNTMAMMLALLWPDLAGPLADPAFLAAAGVHSAAFLSN